MLYGYTVLLYGQFSSGFLWWSAPIFRNRSRSTRRIDPWDPSRWRRRIEKAKEQRWNDIPSGNLAIEHGDIVTMVDLPMKGDGFQSFLYVYQILKNDMGFILIHNMGINHSQLPQSLDGFGGRAHRIGM